MTTKNKKIVAREIIYFFSVGFILAIVFAVLELKNYHRENTVAQIAKDLQSLQISINEIEKLNDYNEQTLILELTKYAEQGATDDEMRLFRDKYYSKIRPWNMNYTYYLDGKAYTKNQIEAFAKKDSLSFENFLKHEEIEIRVQKIKYSKYAFAEMIKQIYPEYKQMDNYELTAKMIEKYPIYKSFITDKPYSPKTPNDDINSSSDIDRNQNSKNSAELQKLYEQKTSMALNLKREEIRLQKDWMLKNDIMTLLTVILCSLLYPLRLIFYLLKWSFKTIKEK